jgi:hypothetical protein
MLDYELKAENSLSTIMMLAVVMLMRQLDDDECQHALCASADGHNWTRFVVSTIYWTNHARIFTAVKSKGMCS